MRMAMCMSIYIHTHRCEVDHSQLPAAEVRDNANGRVVRGPTSRGSSRSDHRPVDACGCRSHKWHRVQFSCIGCMSVVLGRRITIRSQCAVTAQSGCRSVRRLTINARRAYSQCTVSVESVHNDCTGTELSLSQSLYGHGIVAA